MTGPRIYADTVELKKRMRASSDSVLAELLRGDRNLRELKRQRPDDSTIPSPRNPVDPMPIFRAQEDSLNKARGRKEPLAARDSLQRVLGVKAEPTSTPTSIIERAARIRDEQLSQIPADLSPLERSRREHDIRTTYDKLVARATALQPPKP